MVAAQGIQGHLPCPAGEAAETGDAVVSPKLALEGAGGLGSCPQVSYSADTGLPSWAGRKFLEAQGSLGV